MNVQSIKNTIMTNPLKNVMFKGLVENPIQPIAKINLNQPEKDVFEKSENKVEEKVATQVDGKLETPAEEKFELPKDKEFKKPQMATTEKPYCEFDNEKVDLFVKGGEKAIPALEEMFKKAETEEEICEGLYIANAMAMNNVKGVDKMYYGSFSKFNDNKSPNVQSFLSGVYRRILVPDTFGPLVKMLANNIKEPPVNPPFDPNESIGGAILELIKAPKINPL